MYCGKCGAKNEDGDVFCRECGERILGEAPRTAAPPPAREKQGHYRKVGILAVAVVIIAAAIAAFLLFGGKPYERPLKLLTDGVNSQNASHLVQSMLPEKAVQKMAEENEDFMETMEEEALKGFDGQEVKISYKLEEANDALTSDVSNSIRSELDNNYEIKITDQKKLTVKLSVKMEEAEVSARVHLIVYEADGKWYLDPMSLQDAFSDFSF